MNDPTPEEIEALILENVRLGYIEFAGVGPSGEIRYRLTESGKARVKRLLSGDD